MSELNLLELFNTKKTNVFTIKFKALDENGVLKTAASCIMSADGA